MKTLKSVKIGLVVMLVLLERLKKGKLISWEWADRGAEAAIMRGLASAWWLFQPFFGLVRARGLAAEDVMSLRDV